MLTLTRRNIGTIAIAVLALSACGGSSSKDLAPAAYTTSVGDGAIRAAYPAMIHHRVSGDIEFSLDQEGLIDIYEILGGQFPSGSSLLTASVGEGVMTVDDNTLIRWSADLVPGQYEGPGTYTIDGERKPDIAQASGLRSAAYFSLAGPIAGEQAAVTYMQLLEPCTLKFEKDAVSGELDCPKLGMENDANRTVSWTWTWERLEASASSPSPS